MSDLNHIDRNMRILVVDDFQTMRRIVSTCFEKMGFQHIDEAEDGDVALGKLKQRKYDFIVSDWNMPNMMGIDLLREVRGDDSLKDIPFLMVTAEGQQENVMAAVKAGVSNYIVKPFNQAILEEKLAIIFKK